MSDANIVEFTRICAEKRKEFLKVKLKTGREIIKSFYLPNPKCAEECWIPSLPTVQRIFEFIGWHRRTVQARNPMSEPINKAELVSGFLSEIAVILENIQKSNLWVMDESAVFSNSVVQYTYCSSDDKQAYVVSGKDKRRDTIAVTLRADGIGDLFFVTHQTKIHKNEKTLQIDDMNISGMNLQILFEWVDHFIDISQPGDVLLWDNLGSHLNQGILAKLHNYGIIVKFFPARCADELSILDYSWFAIFKRHLSEYLYNTVEEKKEIISEVFYKLLGGKVTCFFDKIGYFSE